MSAPAPQPECVCMSFRNNKLHWALLTYINGFTWPHSYYHCEMCTKNKVSWRQGDEVYKASLVSEEAIVALIKAEPELSWEKNLFGKTPITLIPMMIELLIGVMEHFREENDCARANLRNLLKIQKTIKDIYAKN